MRKRAFLDQLNGLSENLTIVILGASGDLSRRKVLPSLFSLHHKGMLCPKIRIIGYARSDLQTSDLRTRSLQFLQGAYRKIHSSEEFDEEGFTAALDSFFEHLTYVRGLYDQKTDFEALDARLTQLEGDYVESVIADRKSSLMTRSPSTDEDMEDFLPVPVRSRARSTQQPVVRIVIDDDSDSDTDDEQEGEDELELGLGISLTSGPSSSSGSSKGAGSTPTAPTSLPTSLRKGQRRRAKRRLRKVRFDPETTPSRLFYFSLPPHVFPAAARNIGQVCKLDAPGLNRILLEKPFGRDTASYQRLHRSISRFYSDDEIYRIDHYIGKEVVQDLIALRFANIIFDSLWNRSVVQCVQIVFKEELGVEGRGGYFDSYGIVRDVMQNHMMQILCYVAMESPISLQKADICLEKMKVLKSIEPLIVENTVIGQYKGRRGGMPGYVQDPTVPEDSSTATFCACVMFIKNRRWDGVPFMLKTGKALDESLVEIRITFHKVPANIFGGMSQNNELVIRVQPRESIYFTLQNKIPGLQYKLTPSKLDFNYHSRYQNAAIPDAYERLILNCLQGDDSNFVDAEELLLSWRIFEPVLRAMQERDITLEKYFAGSRGPVAADYLVAKFNQRWTDGEEDV